MFSPGGGRAQMPSWFDNNEWGASGEKVNIPLELEFLEEGYGPMSDEPLKRTLARRVYSRGARGSPQRLDVKTDAVAWGLVRLSSIEALLVFSLDLPNGCVAAPDVELVEGTRLLCSTQVWQRHEIERLTALLAELRGQLSQTSGEAERRALQARIKKLSRGLPQDGAPTCDVPSLLGSEDGSGAAAVISSHGQVAVSRMVGGKLLNPFDNGGRWPNPFEPTIEFGVVGTFKLSPPLDGDAPMSLRQGEEQEVTVL